LEEEKESISQHTIRTASVSVVHVRTEKPLKVSKVLKNGRSIAEAVNRWLPTAATRVRAGVWQVGFVVDIVASGQVFSEYFGFPCQKPFIPPTSPSSQSPGAVSRGLATS
jgi:hypothetical protein